MGYKIDLGAWSGIFAVPCDVVDRQLRLAGPVQLKALLYILRHSGRAVEAAELASACGVSEGEAADAVEYWRQEGIICCKGECLAPSAAACDAAAQPAPVPQPAEEQESVMAAAPLSPSPAAAEETAFPEEPRPKAKERIRYSYDECVQMMAEDASLRQMLGVLEGLMCKQLNHTELSVFITLVRWYGMPPACVAMLVEYCREIGKPSIAYIESTGIGWAGEDILTVEQVHAKIDRLRLSRTAWTRVRRLLDIPERAPTKKEQEYCGLWINEYNTCDELILLAYEKCIGSKGKLSMGYMNGIIGNWHKKGITTAQQAAEAAPPSAPAAASADKPPRKGAGAGMYQPTYDKDDIEALLDQDWMDDE